MAAPRCAAAAANSRRSSTTRAAAVRAAVAAACRGSGESRRGSNDSNSPPPPGGYSRRGTLRAVDWSSEDDPLSSPGDDDSFNLGRGALGDQAPEKAFEESLHEAVNAIESIIERASDSAIAAQST